MSFPIEMHALCLLWRFYSKTDQLIKQEQDQLHLPLPSNKQNFAPSSTSNFELPYLSVSVLPRPTSTPSWRRTPPPPPPRPSTNAHAA